VAISVAGVNDAPIAYNVTYQRIGSLLVTAPGLLTNSFEPDGEFVQAVSFSTNTGHGTLAVLASGRIQYSFYGSGPHLSETFQYRVFDTHGAGLHSTSAPATLTIISDPPAANPPSVSISSPTNGAVFTQGANISLNVSISNPDGCQVIGVAYYAGTNLIGNVSSAPYSLVWTNPPAGSNALTAILSPVCSSLDVTSSVVSILIAADSDGDGVSDAQEAINGTNPNDYYDGAAPVLQILSGNFQSGAPGSTLALPFRSLVTRANGTPLGNAPVTFTVTDGGGLLALVNQTNWQSSVSLRADASGVAAAQFQLPASTNTYNYISNLATNFSASAITFVAISTNQPAGGSTAYLDVFTPLK
jgi:hypothetical protein